MDLDSHIRHLHGPEEVPYAPDELVVVCLVRDARPYLKSFIEHYFSLGVKHLVFMDNGSTDGSVEALKAYDNVTILQTELPRKGYFASMKQYLVNRFGRGRWILYVDQDELFDYPYSDVVSLSSFLRYLTGKSYTAVVAQMLDMFPEKPLEGKKAGDANDESLKELYKFYDISNVRIRKKIKGGYRNNVVDSEEIAFYKGGIRKTIFDLDASLTKHPLMFMDGRLKPFEGTAPSHWVNNARVADLTCVLFHYKLLDGHLHQQVTELLQKNLGVGFYRKYLEVLDREPSLRIKQETSRELQSVNDLLEDGFLVVSEDYLGWVNAEEEKSVLRAATQDEPIALAEALLEFRRQERAKTLRMQRLRQRQLSDRTRIHTLEQKLESIHASRRQERKKLKHMERRLESIQASRRQEKAKTKQLEQQLESIQTSRTWKLMKTLRLW